MNLFRFFSKPQSAPAARERLQVLLAHERASTGGSDLVAKLRSLVAWGGLAPKEADRAVAAVLHCDDVTALTELLRDWLA